MTIGERMKAIRLEKNMTQKQIAEKCGMHDSAIRRYESGKQSPKFKTIVKIACALEVTVKELLDEEMFKMLYPDAPKEAKEIDNFASYLNSIGYYVGYFSKLVQVPLSEFDNNTMKKIIENNKKYYDEDLKESDSVEMSEIWVEIKKGKKSIIMDDSEFENLEKFIKEMFDLKFLQVFQQKKELSNNDENTDFDE